MDIAEFTSRMMSNLNGEKDHEIASLRHSLQEARRVLEEARLQIEYLHEKFQETGSGNNVLAQIETALHMTSHE